MFPIIEIPAGKVWAPDAAPNMVHFEVERNLAACKAKLSECLSKEPCKVLLHTHMTYWQRGSCSSWVNAVGAPRVHDLLSGVNLVKVVTLIDNMFDTWTKLDVAHYDIKLMDILNWRSVELLVSDIFAVMHARENKSILVPVRSSMKNIHNIIFSDRRKVYLCFSISEIRRLRDAKGPKARERRSQGEDLLAQNLEFRRAIEDEFAVFDPTGIDELPLGFLAARKSAKSAEDVEISRDKLWPGTYPDLWLASSSDEIASIPAHEIAEVCNEVRSETKTLVEAQLRVRDYRLIDQSNALIAYRPSISGLSKGEKLRVSKGCEEEIGHVARSPRDLKKPFAIIKDPTDGELSQGALNYGYKHALVAGHSLNTADGRRAAIAEAIQKIAE